LVYEQGGVTILYRRLEASGPQPDPSAYRAEVFRLAPGNLPEDVELLDKIESEQLEYDPARLFAAVHRRHKHKRGKPDGTTEFFIAELPDEKDKSLVAPSLKAHVTTEKYLYHMPIYRQVQKIAQSGVLLADMTVGDWINGIRRSLTAIYDALRENIVRPTYGYMMADETSITVLDTDKGPVESSTKRSSWTEEGQNMLWNCTAGCMA
jgi:transposase